MKRKTLSILTLAALTALSGWQCAKQAEDTATPVEDSIVVANTVSDSSSPAVDPASFIFEPTLDTPEELAADLRKIYGWFPEHSERMDFAFEGVTHVNFLQDLGVESIETSLPREGEGGYPTGNSLRLKLSGEKTVLAFRFTIDTLPGPRARGEGILGLFAVHCGDMLGNDIELPRIHASTGRFGLYFNQQYLMAQLSCCDMPPRFWTAQYGTYGDTLALAITFDTTLRKHTFLFMGPRGARVFVGNYYCKFRTERGEFHHEEMEYPYYCECVDPTWINFTLGNRWRGRKNVLEPVLRVLMF